MTLDIAAIQRTRDSLRAHLHLTPAFDAGELAGADVQFKFELLQVAGTFKARGAFANMLALDDAQRRAGVTAISAGNHAVAVAIVARRLGIPAKVVMIRTANPARLALARDAGAEVMLAEDGASGFAMVRDIEAKEGKAFVHPFNGLNTLLGTATLGAEWHGQMGRALDAVILPIGGGGLAGGASTAFKLLAPGIEVYGVEPAEADVMAQSFRAGHPLKAGPMRSIADSLMAPHTEEMSFSLCRANIDRLVTVTDDELRAALRLLFARLKIAVEPACAAATAALCGPLRETLAGKRVGLLLCGSNIDAATACAHLAA